MVQEREEQTTFAAQAKESPLLTTLLATVEETLHEWYHLPKEEIPCLRPENIEFVSDENFRAISQPKTKRSLVKQALRLSGVKEINPPVREEPETTVTHADPFLKPPKIYLRQSFFADLLDLDRKTSFKAALLLGFQLLEMNLALLPEFKLTEDPRIIEFVKQYLLDFFRTRDLREVDAEQLKKTQEIFEYLFDNDPSRKIFLYGAQIVLSLEEGGVDCYQLAIGREIDEAIVLYLADRPEKILLQKFLEKSSSFRGRFGLNSGKERESTLQELRDFLDKLRLRSQWPLLEAYRQSNIPEIFFNRLKVKPQLRYCL